MTIKQRWKQTSVANKLLVIAGFVGALSTTFYAMSACAQVSIMSAGAKSTGEQVQKIIEAANSLVTKTEEANAASRAAIETSQAQSRAALQATVEAARSQFAAANKANTIAAESIEQSRIAFKIGQRAYVLVEKGILDAPPTIGVVPNFTFTLRNTGQTPATLVRTLAKRHIGPNEPAEVTVGPFNSSVPAINIGASQTRETVATVPETPFTTTDISSIGPSGSQHLYWYGGVLYDDVFGDHHFTEFCYVYIPGDLRLVFCKGLNEMRLSVPTK